MVRGQSSQGVETMPLQQVTTILASHIQLATAPPCEASYEELSLTSQELILFFAISAFGILANGLLLLLQCGRSKLSTASFTYLRVVALLQLAFFCLPLPLHFLTRHSQRGVSWTSTNFLPVLLQLWHFTIISLVFCFAVRLQLLINFVRRTRRWTSSGWIAWRKLFCILPLGTILNVSLTFEHRVSYNYCESSSGRVMVRYHKALFSNLKPLVLGLIAAQSAVHLPSTYFFVIAQEIDPDFQLQLYTVAYALPAPLLLVMSARLREHLWLLVGRMVERKKEAVRKATASDGNNITPNPCLLGYSKLEMENSEIEERSLSNHMVRALLRDDAVYRVRFAVHSTVPTVIEEEVRLHQI
ncbi:hypothetical protein PENTCL1PPCAC_16884, partial [Pristionchus entomophagus]